MPLYSYKCKACGTQVSKVHKINESVDLICKACDAGEGSLERVLKGSGFHIAGPGVYREGFSEFKNPFKVKKDGSIYTGKEDK